MILGRPAESEYAPFYAGYVSLVPESDIVSALRDQMAEITASARGFPAERETFRYAPEKWSVRELFGHMVDAERIFGYRLFCISRGEEQALPGFDEKSYIARSDYDGRPLPDIVEEFSLVRDANLSIIERLDERTIHRAGVANGVPITVRALLFVLTGHVRHHLRVLEERYRPT
jgi:hypothetical protein